jgi:hypothetical protein
MQSQVLLPSANLIIQLCSGSAIRPPKIEEVKKRYARFADKFEAVPISDIVNDSFGDAFKGVGALIHTAASLPERASPEDLIKVCI